MAERGVGGDFETADDSEMPTAEQAGSNGKRSQERTQSSSYYASYTASNKGDSSPGERIIKIWTEKAAGWRFVPAKYIDDQIFKGDPGYGSDEAWTDYKKHGWFIHDDRFEVDDPDKDKSSGYTWAEHSSSKDNASHKTSSSKKKKKEEKT